MAVKVLCLFFTVPWVGLQYMIVAFPGHTNFFIQLKQGVLSPEERVINKPAGSDHSRIAMN